MCKIYMRQWIYYLVNLIHISSIYMYVDTRTLRCGCLVGLVRILQKGSTHSFTQFFFCLYYCVVIFVSPYRCPEVTTWRAADANSPGHYRPYKSLPFPPHPDAHHQTHALWLLLFTLYNGKRTEQPMFLSLHRSTETKHCLVSCIYIYIYIYIYALSCNDVFCCCSVKSKHLDTALPPPNSSQGHVEWLLDS